MFCQFVIGVFDKNGVYVDDFGTVARKYLLTATSFTFDFVTSLPWSYMDIYSYQASPVILLSCRTQFPSRQGRLPRPCSDYESIHTAITERHQRLICDPIVFALKQYM